MTEMVVHFPWLHPKLGQGSLPESVVFFDPGVDMDTATPRWRSADLPLSPAEVRAMLRSYMEFGERFPRAKVVASCFAGWGFHRSVVRRRVRVSIERGRRRPWKRC